MFDRFIRLARARKALQDGRFEQAIQLADDPLIRADRRAEAVRRQAQEELQRRGAGHLRAKDPLAAKRDFERALAAGGDAAIAADLAVAQRSIADRDERFAAGRAAIAAARRLGEQGRLAAAEAAAQPAVEVAELAADLQALRAFLAQRRAAAGEQLQQAERWLGDGQATRAVDAFRSARALDEGMSARPLLAALAKAAAEQLRRDTRRVLEAGDVGVAHAAYREQLAALPELATEEPTAAAGAAIAQEALHRLRSAPQPEAELALIRLALVEPPLPGDGLRLAAGCRALQFVPGLRAACKGSELASSLRDAAEQLGAPGLRAEAGKVDERWNEAALRVLDARALAAQGELRAARAALLQVIEAWPLHPEARAEIDAIDQGLHERDQWLQAARTAVKSGRLREGYGLALAQAVNGSAGDEARQLASEIRTRIDLVGRGLDQVRAALHGREAGSADGVRHCLLRIDELAKVQVDHEDLPGLRNGLVAELGMLERIETAGTACASHNFVDASAMLAELVQRRPELLAPDRLDAKLLGLTDRIVAVADEALAAGRLAAVRTLLPGLSAGATLRPDLREQLDRLGAEVERRQQRAEALIDEARQRLANRDLAGAEELCETARQLWVDGPAGRKLEDEVRRIRSQSASIERVAALAADGDLDAAHDRMGDMPPTPPLLRTRIFDMKQELARAQGLDGAFLLRVDEGGEFLVLRGDSLVIGNVRDGRADLPVLAAIAGRHARIQRRLSFHGGMQDSILAEAGEVKVGGERTANRRLCCGDRMQLGANLQLQYSMPSARSLTASLLLLGGFQVAGTDRVLLLKDRGRDGRILIGSAKDAHVTVAGARAEVEVFAHKTGQVRVHCEDGGTIDGRQFRGEHPVDAGAMVVAGGVSFVLFPWVRNR